MKLRFLAVGVTVFALMAPAALRANDERLKEAAAVLDDMAGKADKGIPLDLIKSAKCLVIIPGVKKMAVGIGGEYGKGYMNCRKTGGGWSAPGGISVKGGSAGLQLGGDSTDVVLVVRDEKGVEKLLSGKFTVGADVGVSAGPVGADAATRAGKADILSYSHSKGAFAGIALEGASITTDEDENKELYGKKIDNKDIVLKDAVQPPKGAAPLMTALAKY